jgi:hypothetical protein
MRPHIITFSGLAHSGKDTSADYLVEKFNQLGIKAIKIGLADRLKVISQKLIKLFYDIDIPIEEFYDMEKKELVREDLPDFEGKSFKLRTVLQKVGTEIFRDMLWSGIWCDYVAKNLSKLDEYQVIIISDCRFPDELDYFKQIKSRQLLSIRVDRPSCEKLAADNQTHASEIHVNSLPVNVVLHNSGTLENLYYKLDKISNSLTV